MLTKDQALTVRELHHVTQTQGRGECKRVRRNGRTQTWVTRPDDWSLPVRWGARTRDQFRIDQSEAADWTPAEGCPRCTPVTITAPAGGTYQAVIVTDHGNGITRVKVTDPGTAGHKLGTLVDVGTVMITMPGTDDHALAAVREATADLFPPSARPMPEGSTTLLLDVWPADAPVTDCDCGFIPADSGVQA